MTIFFHLLIRSVIQIFTIVTYLVVHPKLLDVNLQNVTHSLISQNPRERMFLVQFSLLIVTILSLISRTFPIKCKSSKMSSHTLALRAHVNMWIVFFFFIILCQGLVKVSIIMHTWLSMSREDYGHRQS